MTETSTMFLNEMTIVDHAFIDTQANIVGGSFNPSFLVSGKIDPVEKVVVDFSTIKKRVKAMIDDDDLGFDHKCWVIEGFSSCRVLVDGKEVTDYALLDSNHFSHEAPTEVITHHAHIKAPKNAFKFIKRFEGSENYSIENAGVWFAEYLNELFAEEGITVVCKNTVNAHTYLDRDRHDIGYFSYVHGLKDSTSWGCQNIAHGHLSFLQIDSDSTFEDEQYLVRRIARELDYTVFVNKVNHVQESSIDDDLMLVAYDSNRGHFETTYRLKDSTSEAAANKMKIVKLETETTIEFLVEHIKTRYADELVEIGAKGLYVSEGLSKGAYVEL